MTDETKGSDDQTVNRERPEGSGAKSPGPATNDASPVVENPTQAERRKARQAEIEAARKERQLEKQKRLAAEHEANKSTPNPDPAPAQQIQREVDKARPRKRHFAVFFSFFLMVLVPSGAILGYLETIAVDQYESTMGFSVRKEEVTSPVDLLGGFGSLGTSTSSDTDILYEFIQSQKMVELVDSALDLKTMYSKPEFDPVFAFEKDGTIEDLMDYWSWMTRVYYEPGTGLMEVRVLAFTPEDAQAIANEVMKQSSLMINNISAIAREDTIRYAREELQKSVARLKDARKAIVQFRNETQIIDPTADLQGQMGLLNTLQTQLAEALIELDLLRDIGRDNDPRIDQGERKIVVIRKRIQEERRKFGLPGEGNSEAFSELLSQHEALTVDREFAESAYVASLSSYDAAVAEARRQSRYLAAYVTPTFAQSAQYPERLTLFGLASLFLFLFWAIMVLAAYSIRDRR